MRWSGVVLNSTCSWASPCHAVCMSGSIATCQPLTIKKTKEVQLTWFYHSLSQVYCPGMTFYTPQIQQTLCLLAAWVRQSNISLQGWRVEPLGKANEKMMHGDHCKTFSILFFSVSGNFPKYTILQRDRMTCSSWQNGKRDSFHRVVLILPKDV